MKMTWLEKSEDKKTLPKILELEKGFPCYNALQKMGLEPGERIILVNPSEIMPIMAKIPRGKVITLKEICQKIAKNHRVKGCCTLTSGIFIMTIANAAEEANNKNNDLKLAKIPYWRTLKNDGFLNEKYPGGVMAQKQKLEKEGFKIISKGKKFQVLDFAKHLATLN